MAITKAKRSVHLKQDTTRNNRVVITRHLEPSWRRPSRQAKSRSARTDRGGSSAERRNQIRSTAKAAQPRHTKERPTPSTDRKRVRFPEARGKVVQYVEYFADPSSNSVHLRFQDNTSLSFQFATGLAMEVYFSRWKTGNERVLRYWPRIQTEPIF